MELIRKRSTAATSSSRRSRLEETPPRPPAVVADIDAGQDDLTVALVPPEPRGRGDDALHREAPAGAARQGNRAEGAGIVATVLDLEERPRAGPLLPRERFRALVLLVDAGDEDLGDGLLVERTGELRGGEFLRRAEHQVHPADRGDLPGVQLRVAAGDDDERAGRIAQDAPDDLPALAVGPLRHGAGVQDEDVRRLVGRRRSRTRARGTPC